MKELIELRNSAHFWKEYVESKKGTYDIMPQSERDWKLYYQGQTKAYSGIINHLDLILNNSVVKPSERRSPTDESFSGCKPPERKAKSTEDKDKCEHLVERAIGQQGELFVCRKCGEHGQHLSICWA